MEALKHYVRRRRPDQPHSFARIIMKLTDIRTASVKGAEKLLNMHLGLGGNVLPPLVIEMLNRVENVCLP